MSGDYIKINETLILWAAIYLVIGYVSIPHESKYICFGGGLILLMLGLLNYQRPKKIKNKKVKS